MEIEQLILEEENLSKDILSKIRLLIDLNSQINRKCRLESKLRPLSLHSNSKLRSLVGFCKVIDRKRSLRILLSNIKEEEKEEEVLRKHREEQKQSRKKKADIKKADIKKADIKKSELKIGQV